MRRPLLRHTVCSDGGGEGFNVSGLRGLFRGCVKVLRGVFLLGFIVASLEEGQESPDVEGSGSEAVRAEGTR